MPDVPSKPVSGVRVTKAAARDEARANAAPVPGTLLGNLAALEKNAERILADVRAMKHEINTGRQVTRRKTRESVPSIVNLIFVCFPVEYAE